MVRPPSLFEEFELSKNILRMHVKQVLEAPWIFGKGLGFMRGLDL